MGLIAVLAGLGLWLLTEMDLVVTPAALIVVGILLATLPGIVVELVA